MNGWKKKEHCASRRPIGDNGTKVNKRCKIKHKGKESYIIELKEMTNTKKILVSYGAKPFLRA